MNGFYEEDLAYIHDLGFGDYGERSTTAILQILRSQGIQGGLWVELGCGSGITAQVLTESGYQVWGIDISASMIARAKVKAPQATLQVGSFFDTDIPACQGVIAIGECFNYGCNSNTNGAASQLILTREKHQIQLRQLFFRIAQALTLGGLLIFDLVEPGQIPPNTWVQGFREGSDWAVLFEKFEDPEQMLLTRRIITFRQQGKHYQRQKETHLQYLYSAKTIIELLEQSGFAICQIDRGASDSSHSFPTDRPGQMPKFQLPKARVAIVAQKVMPPQNQ